MPFSLVGEESLAPLDSEVRKRLDLDGEPGILQGVDEETATALRRHFLFSRWPDLIKNDGGLVNEIDALYNGYYWLLRFSKYYFA